MNDARPGGKLCGTHGPAETVKAEPSLIAPTLGSYDNIVIYLENLANLGALLKVESKMLTALTAIAKEARLTLVAKADSPKGEKSDSHAALTDEELELEIQKSADNVRKIRATSP
jgi:hypothetical protein